MTPELHATILANSCASSHVNKFTDFVIGSDAALASAIRKQVREAVRSVLAKFNFKLDMCRLTRNTLVHAVRSGPFQASMNRIDNARGYAKRPILEVVFCSIISLSKS
jgi:hypothetical protein